MLPSTAGNFKINPRPTLFSHSLPFLRKTNKQTRLSLFLYLCFFFSVFTFSLYIFLLWALTRGPIVVASYVAEEGLSLPQILEIVQGGAGGGDRRGWDHRKRGRTRARKWVVQHAAGDPLWDRAARRRRRGAVAEPPERSVVRVRVQALARHHAWGRARAFAHRENHFPFVP